MTNLLRSNKNGLAMIAVPALAFVLLWNYFDSIPQIRYTEPSGLYTITYPATHDVTVLPDGLTIQLDSVGKFVMSRNIVHMSTFEESLESKEIKLPDGVDKDDLEYFAHGAKYTLKREDGSSQKVIYIHKDRSLYTFFSESDKMYPTMERIAETMEIKDKSDLK